jgi:hypothetical protein
VRAVPTPDARLPIPGLSTFVYSPMQVPERVPRTTVGVPVGASPRLASAPRAAAVPCAHPPHLPRVTRGEPVTARAAGTDEKGPRPRVRMAQHTGEASCGLSALRRGQSAPAGELHRLRFTSRAPAGEAASAKRAESMTARWLVPIVGRAHRLLRRGTPRCRLARNRWRRRRALLGVVLGSLPPSGRPGAGSGPPSSTCSTGAPGPAAAIGDCLDAGSGDVEAVAAACATSSRAPRRRSNWRGDRQPAAPPLARQSSPC